MEIFNTVASIKTRLSTLKQLGKTIGIVPTMGALHEGHMSLIKQSKEQCDYTVVTVFVNPTQFNNAADLEKYPRTLEQDIKLLEQNHADFLFAPSIEEVYPPELISPSIDLGRLDQVMEGKNRPGHFNGVVQVVSRLFDIIEPDFGFFGMKDFQQVAVIKHMVKELNVPITIVACPILRAENGLALSSRNARLSTQQKEEALIIYQTLMFAKENVSNYSPQELTSICVDKINASSLEVEYIEIVDPTTLEQLQETWVDGAVCCVVAYIGEVRLIDNMVIN